MSEQVAVIGAGPAGLSAAVTAAENGAQVLLVDSGPRSGGQYWRHADPQQDKGPGRWHHGWRKYQQLSSTAQQQIEAGRLVHLHGHQVLSLQPGAPDQARDGHSLLVQAVPELRQKGSGPGLRTITADTVILSPGTYDRQLPVPGWTLPGVMAAGGIQAFIKTQGIAPGQRTVVAGTGPFLLAAAASLLHAGAEVSAIVESSSLAGWIPGVAGGSAGAASGAFVPSKAAEGVEYLALLAKHRVPYFRSTAITAIHGHNRAEALTLSRLKGGRPVPGSERRVEGIDVVGLSWGFVPQAELLVQSGAVTSLDADGSLVGVVDADQRSNIPGLYLAGEITGVSGAAAAVIEGRLAGASAARQVLGKKARTDIGSLRDRAQLTNHRRFAKAMHRAHPLPAGFSEWLEDETLICRCEEVPYSEVREALDYLKAVEPRGLKGVARVGMGWCQGRMCGPAAQCLTEKLAEESAEVTSRGVAKRTLSAPVRLGDLATEEQKCSHRHTSGERGGDSR